MTRRRVTTTYRREYSPERSAQVVEAKSDFGANFNYRELRRRVEHGHQRSPFVWDDWEYEVDALVNGVAKCQHIISPRSQRSAGSSDSGNDGLAAPAARPQKQQSTITNGKHKPIDQARSPVSDDDMECNCKSQKGVKGYKTTKFFRDQGQPARVLSDTISKELKNVSKRPGSRTHTASPRQQADDVTGQPFAQYGTGDDEVYTGNKKTFNVTAPQGVYPSAIRARQLQRHEAELLSNSQNLQEQRSRATQRFDPHFDDKMNRQTSRWVSEYNKNYRPLTADVYARNRHHKPPY